MISDFSQEQWVQRYTAAMLELRPSLIEGCIAEARGEIQKRSEQLRETPGEHREEFQAMTDALSGLKVLEKEERAHPVPTTLASSQEPSNSL